MELFSRIYHGRYTLIVMLFSIFAGKSFGTTPQVKLGFKNKKKIRPPALATQQIDPKTGLIYQMVKCSKKSGLLAVFTAADANERTFEVYVHLNRLPTTSEHLYYSVVDAEETSSGSFEVKLVLSKKDFKMPSKRGKCYIGAKVKENCKCLSSCN